MIVAGVMSGTSADGINVAVHLSIVGGFVAGGVAVDENPHHQQQGGAEPGSPVPPVDTTFRATDVNSDLLERRRSIADSAIRTVPVTPRSAKRRCRN